MSIAGNVLDRCVCCREIGWAGRVSECVIWVLADMCLEDTG